MPNLEPSTHPHATVWKAVRDLARTWAETPTVSRMVAHLPDNAKDQRGTTAATVASLLQGLRAGYGGLFNRPLLLGTAVPFILQQPLGFPPGPRVSETNYQQWLTTAKATDQAHRVTVAWLRSRLPGYPILRAPQLARGTSYTTEHFSTRITWIGEELGAGLQFTDTPPRVPQLLEATDAQSELLNKQTRLLATALRGTPEWKTFTSRQRQLTSTDKAALQSCKRLIGQRIGETDDEGGNLFDDDARRQHHTKRTIDELAGPARAYAYAFDTASALIERTAGDIFGQLVAYGDPATITSAKIDIPRPGIVHIRVENTWDHHPGNIIRIDDPLFADAFEVNGASNSIDALNLKPSTLTLRTIGGTSAWFERS